MTAKEIFENDFAEYMEIFEDQDIYEWAADHVFNLTTYDGALDKLFVRTILDICKVIINKQTYEFIRDENMYVVYIVVCQLLNKKGWIEWGTSIRGAWFKDSIHSKPLMEMWTKVPFTEKNLIALIEFIEEREPKEEVSEE